MNFQLVVLALAAVLCSSLSVNGSPASTYISTKADQTLMKYMMQSRAAPNANNADACFKYYLPILSEISDTFQKDYQACIAVADSQVAELVEVGAESRGNITEVSNLVCENIDACQKNEDNLDFFDCFSNLGDAGVRQVYTISQNASESAANYRETYRAIQIQSEKCTNETQRVYVEDTAKTYDALTDCNANGLKTTVAPSTEPASTTPAPPTTQPPTTIAPSSEPTSTVEDNTSSEGTSSSAAPPSTAEASTTSAPTEADQVEELSESNRIQEFISNWRKRFA